MRPELNYLVARAKLAYGRSIAALLDCAPGATAARAALERVGTAYGGWYCRTESLREGMLAVCCGAGEDISFDVALNARWGVRVLCVDPTPRAIRHIAQLLAAQREGRDMLVEKGPAHYQLQGFRPELFTFVPRAVWSRDGALQLFAPRDPAHVSYSAVNLQGTAECMTVRASTIGTLLRELGLPHPGLVKLDIEGAEHEVIRAMLADNILPDQLLVEFDEINQPRAPLFWLELRRTLRSLRDAGYRLAHREHSNYLFLRT